MDRKDTGQGIIDFFEKTIKSGEDLDNLVRWLKFKNERKFRDHTEEKRHHRGDKQTSMYTLNDNKGTRYAACSLQDNKTVQSTAWWTKSTYSNQVTLTDAESVAWKDDQWPMGPLSSLHFILCTLHIEGTQSVLVERIHMQVKTLHVK